MSKSLRHSLPIHLSQFGRHLLNELQTDLECSSLSETVELLILSQKFSAPEARALLKNRRQRGERVSIVALPDDAVLPPEG